jgi:hypothetical protein
MDAAEFEPLAEIEVDEAAPDRSGFTLTGWGPDLAEYRLGVHFALPLDTQTRRVLAELLTHSELTILRCAARRRAGPRTTARA